MNAQQMQNWETTRALGRRSYLLKRTLLWGTPLSFMAICHSELIRFLYINRITDVIFYSWFPEERNAVKNPIVDFITTYSDDALECFLLAGFIALAVWTYKEQRYAAAKYKGFSLTSNER